MHRGRLLQYSWWAVKDFFFFSCFLEEGSNFHIRSTYCLNISVKHMQFASNITFMALCVCIILSVILWEKKCIMYNPNHTVLLCAYLRCACVYIRVSVHLPCLFSCQLELAAKDFHLASLIRIIRYSIYI